MKTIEEKAKAYDKALQIARKINNGEGVAAPSDWTICETIFPELKETEDEKIRKALINFINNPTLLLPYKKKEYIAWLEKQGKLVEDYEDRLDRCACESFNKGYKAAQAHQKEKQGKQEQLYIRFGEIPANEKSKIYRGEIEVGTENGVSVYPAFITGGGNIVLGLNLPITKTTLHTQQHLLEYDDRPCYLVKGNYVGKDVDGQPLINNVSIIKKIDSYRVKEEKQGEQKLIIDGILTATNFDKMFQNCNVQRSVDKSEPKFKVGDWVVWDNKVSCRVDNIYQGKESLMYTITDTNNMTRSYSVKGFDNNAHLWTIADAKDGDTLACNEEILLFKSYSVQGRISLYCWYNVQTNNFHSKGVDDASLTTRNKICPATKEQRDLLFQKMKEAGYENWLKSLKVCRIV